MHETRVLTNTVAWYSWISWQQMDTDFRKYNNYFTRNTLNESATANLEIRLLCPFARGAHYTWFHSIEFQINGLGFY